MVPSRRRARPITLCLPLLALALLALPSPSAAQGRGGLTKPGPKLSEAARIEYVALTQRAQKIREAAVGAYDIARFDREMAAVRSDMQRWAARHRITLVEKKVTHTLPPEASRTHTIGKKAVDGQVTCDQDMIIDGTTCTLTGMAHDPGSGTYQCVYTCLDLDHPKEAAAGPEGRP